MTTIITPNRIAAALDFEPIKGRYEILGRLYDYIPASPGTSEGMYRADSGHGVSNACFTLGDRLELLGLYLSGRRDGVKKPEALAIVESARGSVAKLKDSAYRVSDDLRAELHGNG